eukprot:GHVT01086239.1.p1 GENE.GHVT01086239.1~~GHVT01086239.1.p1  ORF type:complete len:559 (-),score=96.95 GHVT01086239.1:403-2079(-)
MGSDEYAAKYRTYLLTQRLNVRTIITPSLDASPHDRGWEDKQIGKQQLKHHQEGQQPCPRVSHSFSKCSDSPGVCSSGTFVSAPASSFFKNSTCSSSFACTLSGAGADLEAPTRRPHLSSCPSCGESSSKGCRCLQSTGVSVIHVASNGGENSIVYCPLANAFLSPHDLHGRDESTRVLSSASVVLVELGVSIAACVAGLSIAVARNPSVITAVTVSPVAVLPASILRLADLLLLNHQEASQLDFLQFQEQEEPTKDKHQTSEGQHQPAGTAPPRLGRGLEKPESAKLSKNWKQIPEAALEQNLQKLQRLQRKLANFAAAEEKPACKNSASCPDLAGEVFKRKPDAAAHTKLAHTPQPSLIITDGKNAITIVGPALNWSETQPRKKHVALALASSGSSAKPLTRSRAPSTSSTMLAPLSTAASSSLPSSIYPLPSSTSPLLSSSSSPPSSPSPSYTSTSARHCAVCLCSECVRGVPYRFVEVPRLPARSIVDTVGAGDSFAGALAAFLALGCPLVDATSRAAVVAADSVRRCGASQSYADKNNLPDGLFDFSKPHTHC